MELCVIHELNFIIYWEKDMGIWKKWGLKCKAIMEYRCVSSKTVYLTWCNVMVLERRKTNSKGSIKENPKLQCLYQS